MTQNKYNAKALIDHWKWAVDQNKIKLSTANAWKSACSKVLKNLDEDLENLDIRNIDIDQALNQFTKGAVDFKPTSLVNYQTRFKRALQSYLDYLKDESNWHPIRKTKKRKTKINKNLVAKTKTSIRRIDRVPKQKTVQKKSTLNKKRITNNQPIASDLIAYKFLLRENLIIDLALPRDINAKEVDRLSAFMQTLPLNNK